MSASAARSLMALASFPVLMALLGSEFSLRLWVGTKMGMAAAPIARILILAFWFNALALVSFTKLQAKGRPDLVTKILLLQILPYWAALYFGMTRYGLIGCGVAFLGRMILDYIMQTLVSDGKAAALMPAIGYAGLLSAALLWSQWLGYHDVLWWLGAGLMTMLLGVLSWRDLPDVVRARIIQLRPPKQVLV